MNRLTARILLTSVSVTMTSLTCLSQEQPTPTSPTGQQQILISKETTYYTEPLTDDGYVDYAEALNQDISRGVTPENNLEVILRELMGTKSIPEEVRDEYFRRLGIDMPAEETGTFTDILEFAESIPNAPEQQELFELYDACLSDPWKAADSPFIASWINENTQALDRLLAASNRDRFYAPYIILKQKNDPDDVLSLLSIQLMSIQESRNLARAFTARAMLRIGEERPVEAWRDLQAIHRLSNGIGEGATLIEALVSIAIRAIALEGQKKLLQHSNLTPEQLKAFVGDLKNNQPRRLMPGCMKRGERVFGLSIIQDLARNSTKDADSLLKDLGAGDSMKSLIPLLRTTRKGQIDWNVIFEMFNDFYDQMQVFTEETDPVKREWLASKLDQDIKELTEQGRNPLQIASVALLGGPRERGKQIGTVLGVLLLPAVQQASNADLRVAARADVTSLAFALELQRLQTGNYPDSLDELSRQTGMKIPVDRFNGEPLNYSTTATGFLIYSVGINRTDDDGATYGESSDSIRKADDIRVRIHRQ